MVLVFSPQDYALASRLTGLPVPTTAAEQAAAAPMVASVLRDFRRGAASAPGHEEMQGMSTSATRSLNAYPSVASRPSSKERIESRLQASVAGEREQQALFGEILQFVEENPDTAMELIRAIVEASEGGEEGMEAEF